MTLYVFINTVSMEIKGTLDLRGSSFQLFLIKYHPYANETDSV